MLVKFVVTSLVSPFDLERQTVAFHRRLSVSPLSGLYTLSPFRNPSSLPEMIPQLDPGPHAQSVVAPPPPPPINAPSTPATYLNPFLSRYYNIYCTPQSHTYPLWFFQHPTGTVVVTLAPNSPLLHAFPRPEIRGLRFEVLPSPTHGKARKGGRLVAHNEWMCCIDVVQPQPVAPPPADGTPVQPQLEETAIQLKLPFGISGMLLEVNERLLADPSLLLRQPLEGGFLCILRSGKPLRRELGDNEMTQRLPSAKDWTWDDSVQYFGLVLVSRKTS